MSRITKVQYQRNKEIETFVKNIYEFRQQGKSTRPLLTAELAYINQFTGYGGMAAYGAKGKSLLSEYFTPIGLCEKMVGLAIKHGYKDGPILEPSCGIGRFLHYFAPQAEVTAYEINPTSYQIARLNFPTFNIQHQYFNEVFVSRNGKTRAWKPHYKLVIGNPPYGVFSGKYSTKERQITGAKQYEDYFLTRSLDLLVEGGLLVFIIPSSFLSGGDSSVKQNIRKKAELLEAYRLPKGIFQQTDVQTDIVVFKKLII